MSILKDLLIGVDKLKTSLLIKSVLVKTEECAKPVINPSAYLIKSVGVGSTAIYVDNLRPIFNPQNENDTDLAFQKKIKFVAQESKTGFTATAVVSGLGTISSISISDGGSGYTSAPVVTIGSTVQAVGVGTTALATASITAGVVTKLPSQVQVLDILIQTHHQFLFHLQLTLKKRLL